MKKQLIVVGVPNDWQYLYAVLFEKKCAVANGTYGLVQRMN